MIIKLETLDDLISSHVEDAKDRFNSEETVPVVIGYSGSKRIVVPLFFSSDIEKEMVLKMVTMVFAAFAVRRYTFETEGYMLKIDDKDRVQEEYAKLKANNKRISDHPNHVEILLVGAVSHREKKMTVFEITKDRGLSELEKSELASGRFTELLPSYDIPESAREELLEAINMFGIKMTVDDLQ